jgi:SAM-dependent methyltransferase
MSQKTLQAHYLPNWKLAKAMGFAAYNCGYASVRGQANFAQHQQDLVWRLLGDVSIGAETVLIDVGCGIGGPSGWIFERFGARIIGVEYLSASVQTAESNWSGREARPLFLQGDAHRLPLGDGCADVIFNLESALHYPDKARFLQECRRVLRPGGTLCLGDITTNYKWLFAPAQLLNKLPSQFNSNIRLWSGAHYQRNFKALGLNLIRHEEASAPIANSLADGLREITSPGWAAWHGVRGRVLYLAMLEKLLRSRMLCYDLFIARRG